MLVIHSQIIYCSLFESDLEHDDGRLLAVTQHDNMMLLKNLKIYYEKSYTPLRGDGKGR